MNKKNIRKKWCSIAVAASLLATQVFAVSFSDIGEYDWASDAITNLSEKNIIVGIGGDRFAPQESVTREQLAKMLVLAFDIPTDEEAQGSFSDVGEDRWSFAYIEAAKELFDLEEVFEPESPASRLEVAMAVAKAVTEGENPWTDSDAWTKFSDLAGLTDEEKAWVSAAVEMELIEGFPDGTFAPDGEVTRAECAVMIDRAMNLEPPKTSPSPTPSATPSSSPSASPSATPSEPTPTPDASPSPSPEDSAPARSDFLVVSAVVETQVDGTNTQKVTGLVDGEEMSFTVEHPQIENISGMYGDDSTTIQVGDVLFLTRDIKSDVRNVSIVFRSKNAYNDNSTYNAYEYAGVEKLKGTNPAGQNFCYGLVRAQNGKTIQVVSDDTVELGDDVRSGYYVVDSDTNAYIYNPNVSTKVKVADVGDISVDRTADDTPESDEGDFVFFWEKDGLVSDLLIVSGKRSFSESE